MAFVAGTGILPFVDFIATVARDTIGMGDVDGQTEFGPGFHLWIVAKMNSEEPIAHELCVKLDQAEERFTYDVV